MKFDAELNKPVIVIDDQTITLRQLAEADRSGQARVFLSRYKAFGARNIISLANVHEAVAHSPAPEAKRLAIARLRASPGSTYRFLDGKTFTSNEAITQIELNTKVGDYFTKLEKRAAEIALEALAKGKIHL